MRTRVFGLILGLTFGLCGVAWGQTIPPNTLLNHDGTQYLQNEEQIWISLTDSLYVMADWRDWRLGYRRIGFAVSSDAGVTWGIDSLVVGRTENPELSRMTIVVAGDQRTLEQVRKQLAKLVEAVKVVDYAEADIVDGDPDARLLDGLHVGHQHRRITQQLLLADFQAALAVGAIAAEYADQFFRLGLKKGGRHDVHVEMPFGPQTICRRGAQFQTTQVHRGSDVVFLAETEQMVRAA